MTGQGQPPAASNQALPQDAGQESQGSRLPYQPGIDGLRAVSVLAVLLYHAGLPWIQGGFLGVEVFFVISGYLITALLLAEWQRQGRINLKSFWLRRARRLLPALFVLLAGVLTYAVLFLPEEVAGLRADALAAMTYITNWYLILADKPYFEIVGRPSLLLHLWSLAIEEQFYLLWPLLLMVVLGLFAQRKVLALVILAAVASALWMAFLYRPDSDPSRVYYGTDTRAAGLLIGSALAFVWAPGRIKGRAEQIHPVVLDLAGVGGLVALFVLYVGISAYHPLLYLGAFPLVGLATIVVIAVVVHPRARLVPAVLGVGVLRWIGLRSYGIYLWHWPVFMVTRPYLDVPFGGLPLLAVQFIVAGVLAELSFRLVETPIRGGALSRAWQALREARGPRRWWLTAGWTAALAALLAFCIVLGVPIVNAQLPARPDYLAVESVDTIGSLDKATPVVASLPTATAPETPTATWTPIVLSSPTMTVMVEPSATAPPAAAGPPGGAPMESTLAALETRAMLARVTLTAAATKRVTLVPSPSATASPFSSPTATATPLPNPMATPTATPSLQPSPSPLPTSTPDVSASMDKVTAIGDSVMQGAVDQLQAALPNVEISTEIGREVPDAVNLLWGWRNAGQLGSVVVVHLGNNGAFRPHHFDDLMQVLDDTPTVVILNNRVPRYWQDYNNRVLHQKAEQYPRIVLLNWYAASNNRHDLFWDDGIHLRPAGAQYYANLIAAAIEGR